MVFSTFKETLHLLKSLKVRTMISGRYSRISSTSDVPFDKDLEYKIEGNSSKQQQGSGPYYRSIVFHSLKAMQDVHVCMYACVYVYICFTR